MYVKYGFKIVHNKQIMVWYCLSNKNIAEQFDSTSQKIAEGDVEHGNQ